MVVVLLAVVAVVLRRGHEGEDAAAAARRAAGEQRGRRRQSGLAARRAAAHSGRLGGGGRGVVALEVVVNAARCLIAVQGEVRKDRPAADSQVNQISSHVCASHCASAAVEKSISSSSTESQMTPWKYINQSSIRPPSRDPPLLSSGADKSIVSSKEVQPSIQFSPPKDCRQHRRRGLHQSNLNQSHPANQSQPAAAPCVL
ncbi:hypothetical protein M409DRAFT_53776 [Zasmidium cellare ATCC 36951]|uniref:Uncharacterized protein n=1 Tax=Zasmidium cellare ATCC 36951 TaxID=1080233 RepID=A0A6A6CMG6_ZASCE|nr:uncharacterized protein M409DRAFT_53776 [Zasmidium cellare ATCC 36951]KAF2167813.1 hypothetical protein M409DRAFT_53776 [Zasmidium cellare ATCC 36951]